MPESTAQVVQTVGAIFGLLLLASATNALAKRIGIRFPIALVLVGIVVSLLGNVFPFLAPITELDIPPSIALFVFLPTLVFEAAFNVDGRDLRENLGPVLTLAIPALMLSTLITGAILYLGGPALGFALSAPEALLIGAVLSSTDPVGVSELFRQIGAPKRLTMLVEGESLFNDATSIALSRLLIGILLTGGASAVTADSLMRAALDFTLVFAGGLAVGWGAAVIVGLILGWVEDNPFIEISLTTVLAYLAFILAEEGLGVSGVMAALAAGLVIGGWGKTKVSPSVAEQLENQWEYLATVANSLVFLMVGLMVDLNALLAVLPMLGLALAAMLLSRAMSVFGLMPLVGRIPGTEPIDRRYQTVIFWGGMRGGVALAIALALPPIPGKDTVIVPLVMGAVLFTLLVQGLTIGKVVRYLKLHVPPLSDRVARIEGLLAAKERTLEQIPELQAGGLFSPRIGEAIRQRCEREIGRMRAELGTLRERELDLNAERPLLYLRCFGEEKTLYYHMFSRGHLSERAYRDVTHSIELQTEAIRHEGRLPDFTLHPPTGERRETVFFRVIDSVPGMAGLAERLRAGSTARDYEIAWARSRGSRHVLEDLEQRALRDDSRAEMIAELRALYQYWHEGSRARLDQTAEQFPEFVAATQERLADRLVLHAEHEAIEEKAHSGIIPEGVAEAMLGELTQELRDLRASQATHLRVEPEELLRKVPFFQGLPTEDFMSVAERLRRRTAPSGEVIVRQGGSGDSLFLVARGVIRVSRLEGGAGRDLATLMAGDFFGESALLHGSRRNATCRAVSPCALYELRRDDFDAVVAISPTIRQAIEDADRKRRAHRMEGGTAGVTER